MEWKFLKTVFTDWLSRIFGVIFILCLIIGAIKLCTDKYKKTEETTTPVERYEIDSITKENDKLIIEVEYLDSIKNAKVIEVKSLDNDSTIRLFYKLIRK